MTITVDEVAAKVIERYPDIQDATNAALLRYIQDADLKVASILPYRHDTFDLTLVSGTPDYAFSAFPNGAGGSLGSNIARIYSAIYMRSANQGDWKNLTGRDPRWLDKHRGVGWRLNQGSEPSEYAVDAAAGGRRFWLINRPMITTSGGYPIVRLYTSTTVPLAYGGDICEDLPSDELFVSHICWKWAKTNDRKAADGWRSDFIAECANAERFLYNFIEQENANIVPGFYPQGGIT